MINVLRHPGGYAIVPIHYSMDPEKDSAWLEATRRRYIDSDWEKEYEINFQSVSGAVVYETFSVVANTAEDVVYSPHLPVRLSCDFNVEPMAWLVFQIKDGIVYVIEEIYLKTGSVIKACDKFLEGYAQHEGEVIVYGDASGRARSQLNQRSNYDELQLRLANRPFSLNMKVPRVNPSVVNRIKSVNNKMKNPEGKPGIIICRPKCTNLLLDLSEVVWAPNGSDIKKVKDQSDPYFYRTHMSDALGYAIDWEFPLRAAIKSEGKSVKRHKKKRKLLGMME